MPRVAMVLIAPAEAPTIDGDISDPIWAKAAVIDEFRQTEPDIGEPVTFPTVVRMLYDENNLYFAIYNYQDPKFIRDATIARDANVAYGDFVRIYLDPYLSRRNAFSFEIGPSGGRLDALVQNNTDYLREWNIIWDVRTRIVEDGWVAEARIPLRELSYDPDRDEWGFDFFRAVRHPRNERFRWGSANSALNYTNISQPGIISNMSGVGRSFGPQVQLYSTARYQQDWVNDRGTPSGTASGNAYYKITPALTGTLTVNPDFSDSPLDERQVNTSRFSLFQPETRAFFLQDAAAFEFGGRGFINSQNARPFFSRNIGLINGRPVSILGGAKLSGNFAGIDIGALTVMTDEKYGADRQVLSVARLSAAVTDTLRIGTIVTNGDPTGLSRNTLAGVDVQYLNTAWGGDKTLQADVYYERSFSSTKGQDYSYAGVLNFPNEPFAADFRFKQVGTNFTPALGFANRTGIRAYDGGFGIHHRPGGMWRYWDLLGRTTVVTDLQDRLQSRESSLLFDFLSRSSDSIDIGVVNYFEDVSAPFALPGGVLVPAGEYHWTNAHLQVSTAVSRPWTTTIDVLCCSFYDGKYLRADFALNYTPDSRWLLSPRYVATFIELPTGYVAIHVLSMDMYYNFSPEMQIRAQAQFDNISKAFGFSLRYRWEYTPGNDVFVALGQTGLIPGVTTFTPQASQFSVRLGRTMQF